jgi:hypothetical protein
VHYDSLKRMDTVLFGATKFRFFWLLATAVLACGNSAPPAKTIEPSYTWCPAGFEVGAGDTCFALPKQKANAPVAVYLHSASSETAVLAEYMHAKMLVDLGYAVILTRGKQEACGFTREQKEALCWDESDLEATRVQAAGWDKAAWQVSALLDGDTHPRYLLGVKEGATHVLRLLSTNLFPGSTYGLLGATAESAATLFDGTQGGSIALFGTAPIALRSNLDKAHWHYVACPESAGDASGIAAAFETLQDLNSPAHTTKGLVLRDPKCHWSGDEKRKP